MQKYQKGEFMFGKFIIGLTVLLLTACTVEKNEKTGKLESTFGNPITAPANAAIEATNNIHKKMLENQEKAKLERYNSEKMKIWVRGKDVKTCMRILKINEIDNEITECTKSRHVEMRRDEVESFKLANEM